MADVNLSPYTAESAAIDRRRKMAELIQAQAMQPSQDFTFNGIKSTAGATQNSLTKMLQTWTGVMGGKQADQDMRDLSAKQQSDRKVELGDFMAALTGQAAQPERAPILDPQESAQVADGMGEAVPNIPAGAAVPGDQRKAMALALASQNPALQGAGGAMLAGLLKPSESAFAKIDPSKFTAASVKDFEASGGRNFSILVPRDKLEFQNLGNSVVGLNPYSGTQQTSLATSMKPGEVSRLQWDQFQHLNPSAFQRAELGIQGANAGANLQRTQFETGATGGNIAPALPPMGQMPNFGQGIPGTAGAPQQAAPAQAMPPQMPPQAPQGMRPQMPPQAAPQMPPQGAAQPADGLTPAGRAGLAKDKALKDQDAARQLPQVIATANLAIKNIDDMIGDTDRKGGTKKPHPGFESAIGAGFPGLKYVPGSDTADFTKRLEQVKGGAFLQAFEALKGGGQITEIEGAKATAALNRMSESQSEKEFITAAREYQDVMRGAVDRAKGKAGGATGGWAGAERRQGQPNVIDFGSLRKD